MTRSMVDIDRIIRKEIPYLRRYARAVTGDQKAGDQAVRAMLEHIDVHELSRSGVSLKVALFRALHELDEAHTLNAEQPRTSCPRDSALVPSRLLQMEDVKRKLLLLVLLERFSKRDCAVILDLAEGEATRVYDAAMAEVARQPSARVLIIEDEPIIALDLSHLVAGRGHEVVGVAAGFEDAVRLGREQMPNLILADIELSDRRDGIAAIEEITRKQNIPVIFITAFPERVLTGQGPEPTFLISKPFEPELVDVCMAQALATKDRAGRRV